MSSLGLRARFGFCLVEVAWGVFEIYGVVGSSSCVIYVESTIKKKDTDAVPKNRTKFVSDHYTLTQESRGNKITVVKNALFSSVYKQVSKPETYQKSKARARSHGYICLPRPSQNPNPLRRAKKRRRKKQKEKEEEEESTARYPSLHPCSGGPRTVLLCSVHLFPSRSVRLSAIHPQTPVTHPSSRKLNTEKEKLKGRSEDSTFSSALGACVSLSCHVHAN
jgi:hypothetical protein